METRERVEVTRFMLGICHCQVCAVADATDEEILREANWQNPSGTRHGWLKVIRDTIDPDTEPVPCASGELGARIHFLVEC
jgi:hypothetical protein